MKSRIIAIALMLPFCWAANAADNQAYVMGQNAARNIVQVADLRGPIREIFSTDHFIKSFMEGCAEAGGSQEHCYERYQSLLSGEGVAEGILIDYKPAHIDAEATTAI